MAFFSMVGFCKSSGIKMFKDSAGELKNVRCIAATGLLIAIFVILKGFLTVPMGFSRLNFAFIALAAIGMLYGPSVGVLAAIPCDILGAVVLGNGINFIFTLIIMFNGLIYGLFLYRYQANKSIKQSFRILIAQFIVVFISQLLLNTAVLYLMGFAGQDYDSLLAFLTTRVVKNVLEYPIDVILMFILLAPLKHAYKKAFKY